jgi:putative ABC transport system permease protein
VLTIAVLFMAISTCLGISNAVLSVEDDIHTWYERAINADFLLRAMMPDISGHAAPSMSESLGDEIRALGGVERIDPVRVLGVNAGGREAVLMARDFSLYDRVPVDVLGDDEELLQQLAAGEAVVGSVLAERLSLHPGDHLDVTVGTQKHSFRIAALATEYAFGGSIVTVDRGVAGRVFGLQGVDSYMIKAEPGRSAELEPKLQALADEKGLLLQSFREIVRIIDGTVTQITGGLWVLLIGGLIVGTLGVVNTLAMNVLEQTRELGMLRAIGMRRGQIIKTVLGQAAIIGWLGILTGGMSGVGLSHTINACLGTLFGRYIRFAWRPEFAVLLVSCALAAVLIAALYPARRAANLNPLEAMRQD